MWILKKDVVQREEKRLSPPQLGSVFLQGVCFPAGGLSSCRGSVFLQGVCIPAGWSVFLQGVCIPAGGLSSCRGSVFLQGVCIPAGGLKQLMEGGVRAGLKGTRMASLLPPAGSETFRRLKPASTERVQDRQTSERPSPGSEPGTCWGPQGPVTDRLSGQNLGPVGDHRDLLQMVSRIRTWDLLGTTGTCESPTPRSEPGTCWGPQGPVTDRLSGQNPGPVGDHRDLLQMVSQIRTRDLLGTTGTCESPTPRSEPGTCWGPQGPVTDRLSGQNPGPVGDHRDLLQMVSRIRTRDLLGTTGTCYRWSLGSEPGTCWGPQGPVVQLEAGKPLPFFFGYPPPEFLNIPLEEMDPYYQSQKKTLFSLFILLTILSSCVFMTLSEPPEWSSTVERVFMAIFTFEAVVKVVARGLCAGRFTFLRDGWNWLDVLVICTGRSCLKKTVGDLVQSVKRLGGVIALMLFFFGLCALIGQHAFMGNLSHKCVVWPPESSDNQSSQYNYSQYDHTKYINDHANFYYLPDQRDALLCGNASDAGACPPGYSCMRTGRNPDYGYTSFDSFSWSLLSVVRLVSKDFWENLMLQVSVT
ncbi:Sodium channel protein type 4 subunit alpha B [Dissostichus eleginoides]|uniref:Sodium channel protein type 4 subunit alpha B n=1 Tax=Dissostichus eleginoides TaxID=100907 RepID=A0AAD9B7A4_DISEL|nr:Sodium channel protein type 4 subunit alpha B [Dissostichus eleginoides]